MIADDQPALPRAVIPAKAGIHVAVAFGSPGKSRSKLDPSFRWDDDQVQEQLTS
jgi:hypothetical protein